MIKELFNHYRFQNKDLPKWIAILGIGLFLCVFPLYMSNGLFNLVRDRATVLGLVSLLCSFGCIVSDALTNKPMYIRSQTGESNWSKMTNLFLLLFCLSGFASLLVTDYVQNAISGDIGRNMGLLTVVCMALSYFFISKYGKLHPVYFYAFGTVVLIVVGIAYLQFIGLDPFHFYKNLNSVTRRSFISTMGNINVFSSFICAVMPVFSYRYCMDEKRPFFDLFVSIACYIGVFVCNSDSAYIGLMISIGVICFCALRTGGQAIRNFLWLCTAFCASAKFFSLFCMVGGDAVRSLSRMTQIVTKSTVGYIALIVFLALALLYGKKPIPGAWCKKLSVVYVELVCAILCAVVILIFWYSIFDTEIELVGFGKYLRIDEQWGTGRAAIWKLLLSVFKDIPVKQKLFGIGPDCIGLILKNDYSYEMYMCGNDYVDNAHNEFLQYLLTMGLFGLVSYVGFLICGIGSVFFGKNASHSTKAFALGALCYAAQSFVNITQPITTPFVFIFIGLAQIGLRVSKKEAV